MAGSFDRLLHAPGPPRLEDARAAAFDERFWLTLVADVDAAPDDEVTHEVTNEVTKTGADIDRLRTDGVLHARGVIPATRVAACLEVLAAVRQRGWPSIFAALHPIIWRALASRGVAQTLRDVLGDGCRLAPRLWITHVYAVAGDAGWPPHLDAHEPTRWRPDGAPTELTAWFPLTDATVDNGCIHIVPPDVAGAFPADVFNEREIPSARLVRLLHGVRALPSEAGDLLLWPKNVIHWGGRSTGEGRRPRVSITTEWLHEDAKRAARSSDSIDLLAGVPGFDERVRLVGRQILKYVEYDDQRAALTPFRELAQKMLRA